MCWRAAASSSSSVSPRAVYPQSQLITLAMRTSLVACRSILHARASVVKFLGGLFALAYVASVFGDRTRPLPDPSVAVGKEKSIKRYETGIHRTLRLHLHPE